MHYTEIHDFACHLAEAWRRNGTQCGLGGGEAALPEYGSFTGNAERKTQLVGEKKR